MPRKPVILESPYSGDIYRNSSYAVSAMRDSITRNEAPFASHLLYTRFLRDMIPEERKIGLECSYAWFRGAKAQVFYTDLGWSEGMLKALLIGRARLLHQEWRGIIGPAEPPPLDIGELGAKPSKPYV